MCLKFHVKMKSIRWTQAIEMCKASIAVFSGKGVSETRNFANSTDSSVTSNKGNFFKTVILFLAAFWSPSDALKLPVVIQSSCNAIFLVSHQSVVNCWWAAVTSRSPDGDQSQTWSSSGYSVDPQSGSHESSSVPSVVRRVRRPSAADRSQRSRSRTST